MYYEVHAAMCVSISADGRPANLVALPSGRREESTRDIWFPSTNAPQVAQMLDTVINNRHGLRISSSTNGDITRATSFTMKYDRRHWTLITAGVAVLEVIDNVNQRPRPLEMINYPERPQVRPTRYPAGYVRR
jgi:hypothetical protein